MKFKDAIEILRPINGLMGGLTVIIGILNTRIGIPLPNLIFNIIFGVLIYFFISGSSMIINDYYDVEIDKINRPERTIPRGSISLKQAKILWVVTILIASMLSIIHSLLFIGYQLFIGYLVSIIVVFMAFIGWFYAAWGKKSGFFGNIIVGISFSIGLIYGAMLNNAGIPPYIYYFFLTSFFLLLSREVIKGCEDIEGDKKEGVKTLAIKIGIKKSTKIAMVFAIIAIVFYILPLFTVINQLLFLISMVFGLAVVIFAVILMLKSNLTNKDFKKVSLLLKIGAFLGLLTFLLASF